jgi:hypothetical protein
MLEGEGESAVPVLRISLGPNGSSDASREISGYEARASGSTLSQLTLRTAHP